MRHQLTTIQALRAAAATAVVVAHLATIESKYVAGPSIFPHAVEFAALGVDLFFVISGFIIATMSLQHFGVPGAWRRFLAQRFLRIYPVYWFYCLLVLPVFLLRPGMVNSSHGTPNLLTSFLLLPDYEFPLLLVAWSLVFEVFFYAMFAVLLAHLPRRHLPIALGLWALAVAGGRAALGPMDDIPLLGLAFHPLTLEFLAGCAVALTVTRLSRDMSAACVVAGIAVMGAGLAAWSIGGITFPESGPRAVVCGTASALLVAGLVGLERTTSLTAPRPLVRLGDASYSLYLSHVLTLSAFGLVCRQWVDTTALPIHVALVAAAFVIAMLGGWFGYCMIEVPLLAGLRGLRWPRLQGVAVEVAMR